MEPLHNDPRMDALLRKAIKERSAKQNAQIDQRMNSPEWKAKQEQMLKNVLEATKTEREARAARSAGAGSSTSGARSGGGGGGGRGGAMTGIGGGGGIPGIDEMLAKGGKVKGYAKGGSVKGSGCEQRGLRKCKVV
jgi:hypothetical protein